MKDDNYLKHLRHSTSHLLAAAVVELYPDAKLTLGPAIEEGFYYDIDFGNDKISEEDFSKIEQKMHELVKSWKEFEKHDVSKSDALKEFKGNKYKIELIEEHSQDDHQLTVYESGSFRDLCRGGHVDKPSEELKHFKLLSVAGAYWRGSEKNKMITRIYGTIFPTQKELDEYLKNLELAKLHDHRKLGKELQLFAVSDEVGQGLILWLPKGNIIKEEIENWAKDTEKAWGYQRVTTPNITKSGLYYTSGHLPYYQKDMYPPMKLDDGEEYFLKPMNCPHHHMIYKARPRSYKELPLRLAEYGTCYRYEASGELFGLMRVRGFAQNDSHIYCTQEQAVNEFVQVMKLHEYYYKSLGIKDYYLELALRDPENKKKYHGNEEMWVLAEKLMREAVKRVDIPMVEKTGSAAFYGPKIDFIIKSSIGREFAISTNQIDLFMGDRFGLKYTDKDGTEKTPVIIHRAPLGSHERFIGFLIEHFAGVFPMWLAPVQAVIIPISDEQQGYAATIYEKMNAANIRVENWDESGSMQKKIRSAEKQKIPCMIIIGKKEVDEKTLSVRSRGNKDNTTSTVDEMVDSIKASISERQL
ncbi:MAG TPA: threonine--tRNA ligase [Patescibacteria group bacterium]|nr:threonine--tRNA ligase [Patescibacteria group bacterium]